MDNAAPTDKAKIATAFARLRTQGFICETDWQCCQSCGWAAIEAITPDAKNIVFYHDQDAASLDEGGMLTAPLHMCWSGDGQQIASALEAAGLAVEWNGQEDRRIAVRNLL